MHNRRTKPSNDFFQRLQSSEQKSSIDFSPSELKALDQSLKLER